ncbi:MAG: carbon-nitrogen hydrolase family protein [Coriobacteriales bacterium]|nr:carbon-nitrogen hydrolase family protein [Coriobacteriales bacterium]
MKDLADVCKIAVVQSQPTIFNKEACLNSALDAIRRVGREHPSDLIVLPELLVPGYPHGLTFGFVVGMRKPEGQLDWKRYYDGSLVVGGPETTAIADAAREVGSWVSIGISERDAVSGTLYNTNLVFDPQGRLDAWHRKLKPTGAERLVWGDAQDRYFPVSQTPWGPMGTLICWENYMPLARVALYQKGVTIYLAPNTNGNEEWQATVRHIAMEGRCYVVNCAPHITRADYPSDLQYPEEVEALPDVIYRGGSCVVDPYGHYVPGAEPLWDQSGILYADLQMQEVAASKWEFDPVGHYARPDVLRLQVNDI